MKITTSLTLALTFCAGTAFAGSLETPVIPTVTLAAPTITDWSGVYVGGVVSSSTANMDYFQARLYDSSYSFSGVQYGGFAGVNFQSGSMVYGIEAAYLTGDITDNASPQDKIYNMFDLKGRVGYAFGQTMVYGILGASIADYTEVSQLIYSIDLSGINYGVGAEYKIGNNMFVGAEYLMREIEGNYNEIPTDSGKFQIQSAELRVGWRF